MIFSEYMNFMKQNLRFALVLGQKLELLLYQIENIFYEKILFLVKIYVGPILQIYGPPPSSCRLRLQNRLSSKSALRGDPLPTLLRRCRLWMTPNIKSSPLDLHIRTLTLPASLQPTLYYPEMPHRPKRWGGGHVVIWRA